MKTIWILLLFYGTDHSVGAWRAGQFETALACENAGARMVVNAPEWPRLSHTCLKLDIENGGH